MTVWISLNCPASHFAWFSYCWGKQVCINVLLWSHKVKDKHVLFFFCCFFWPSESQGYKGSSRQIIHLILIHDLEKRKKMNKVRHIKATDTFKHSFFSVHLPFHPAAFHINESHWSFWQLDCSSLLKFHLAILHRALSCRK